MFGFALEVYPQGIDIPNSVACKTSDAREGDPFTGVRGRGILRSSSYPPSAKFAAISLLSALVGELAALKADAHHWLEGPEYAALRHRL